MLLAIRTSEGEREDGLPVVSVVLEEGVDLCPHLVAQSVLLLGLGGVHLRVELLQVVGVDVDNLTCRVAVLLRYAAVLDDSAGVLIHIAIHDAVPRQFGVVVAAYRGVVEGHDEVRGALRLGLAIGGGASRVGADAVVAHLLLQRLQGAVGVKGRHGCYLGVFAGDNAAVHPLIRYIYIVDTARLVLALQAALAA